jgi:ribonuclease BN (tRNA processing enzyme)
MGSVLSAWLAVASVTSIGPAQAPVAYDSARTQVVMLGTGTPNPDPDRSGPALAVVVRGRAYLVDAGPGIVRRAAAAERAGVAALGMERLTIVFLTHLHSDHTLGLPDLLLTPWVLGRTAPLAVYGPHGTSALTHHLVAAYADDIANRRHGAQPHNDTGWQAQAHEIRPGQVYKDDLVTVIAFPVPHAGWREAYGYRFETPDRTIVISGDTRPDDAVVRACDGCDVLVHEVYSQAGFDRLAPAWQRYHAGAHTSAVALGALAARARPKLLVLTHGLPWSSTPAETMREVRAGFAGPVAYANDLDIY